MSESSNSRIEAKECLRKANSCNDRGDRWAWLMLARFWLLLAETQETEENVNLLHEAASASSLAQQFRQLGNICRNSPRLVAGQ